MKHHPMHLIAAPLLLCALSTSAHAFVTLTGLTPTSTSTERISSGVEVATLSDASNTYSSLIGPTESSISSNGTIYKGTTDPDPYGSSSTVLLGKKVATAVGNVGTVRVLFGQTITNLTGSDVFITEIGVSSQEGDPFTNIRAIVGGTLAEPVYGSVTLASVADYTEPGASGIISYLTINTGNFEIRGFGLDILTDLGESSIIGLEFNGGGGSDPGLVLAQVPEPSSALLGALGALALLRRKRR